MKKTTLHLVVLLGALCGSGSAEFVHPGGLHKKSDLQRMRYMVEAKIDPWYTSFLELQEDPMASFDYAVRGDSFRRLSRDGDRENAAAYQSDVTAAYLNALMWAVTRDERHAAKCVEIFNAWNSLICLEGRGTASLNGGLFSWKLLEAAEIIRGTYPGWLESDMKKFKKMLVYPGYSDSSVPSSVSPDKGTFYWRIYMGDSGRHGNQDMIGYRAMLIMGVFLDNRVMYDRALRYFKGEPGRRDDIPMPTGPSPSGSVAEETEYYISYNHKGSSGKIDDYGYNGVLTNYFWENGQCQESSRDQHHAFFGMGIAAGIAEVAWNQGDPVWNAFDNRLLKAFEFASKYNTSYIASFPDQPEPWEPTDFIQRLDRTGRWFSKKINPYIGKDFDRVSRGAFPGKRPIYEQAAAHFGIRMGMNTNDYLWTLRGREVAIEKAGYEKRGFSLDHAGWGALTFRRPPLAAGDPISGFSEGGSPKFEIHQLPGVIEAENYDFFPGDGEGHTYHDLSSGNSGETYRGDGVDITRTGGIVHLTDLEPGEWSAYTVGIPMSGLYSIGVRYAAADNGGTISFSFGSDTATEPLALQVSRDWTTQNVVEQIELEAGVQVLRLHIGGSPSTRIFLDRVEITRAD